MSLTLTPANLSSWLEDGFLLIRGFLAPSEVFDVQRWASDIEAWPQPSPPLTCHTLAHEIVDGELRVCRVENFTPTHGGLAGIAERLAGAAAELLEASAAASAGGGHGVAPAPARLFKEKLNIKPPGGRGYGAHYDGPSAASVGLATRFVTAQVAVDAQTVLNGCLQLCSPRAAWPCVRTVVEPTSDDPDRGGRIGAIPDDVSDALEWTPIECEPGDILFFDHWTPHWSSPNRDTTPRRTLYMLFNSAAEGDFMRDYYARMHDARVAWAEKKRASAPPNEAGAEAEEDAGYEGAPHTG